VRRFTGEASDDPVNGLMKFLPMKEFRRSMKEIYAQAAIVVLATLLGLPAAAVESGQAAPEFDLPGRLGAVKLSDFKGKTVYLDFWASWCGPCRQSFPWLNDIQARYGGQGLRVVSVNVDQKIDDARAFLKDNPAGFDVAFDQAGKIPRAYAIKGMPTSVLIGPDGRVLMVHLGFRNDQRVERERLIRLTLDLKD
jgi:cytochrome c biogenesis protein CcmG, thiol:disulfide interchange protein DsbE